LGTWYSASYMSQAHDQKRFTISEVAYWLAMTLGGAAQLAAAHCLNERNLDPQSAARQTHPCPGQPQKAFTPQCSPAASHYFSSESYQVLIATHLPTPEGWKAELT